MRICVTALAVLACAGADEADRAVPVAFRDSAGIAITTNTGAASAAAESWYLDDSPLLIGELDGDPAYQLFAVRGAKRLADGRIAVLDSGSREIRFFNATGAYAGSAGQDGEGPGEFRSPRDLARMPADSLMVWDTELQRISIFDEAGTFARSFSLQGAGANPLLLGFLSGDVVMVNHQLVVPASGFEMTYAALLRYSGEGEFRDTMLVTPWMEVGVVGERQSGQLSGPVFSPRTFVTLRAGQVWVGTGAEPSIDGYDRDGTLTSIVRWSAGDRQVRPGDAALHNDRRFGRMPAELRRGFDELPVAERYPAHADIGVDAGGNLWVRRFRRPTDEGHDSWRVFRPDGSLRARVDTPDNLEVLETGPDWVLGVLRDELGVERVAMFGLKRPG